MKRKSYQEPTMRIVQLQQTQMLAASGEVTVTRSGYDFRNDEEWE